MRFSPTCTTIAKIWENLNFGQKYHNITLTKSLGSKNRIFQKSDQKASSYPLNSSLAQNFKIWGIFGK
jgi:hypothetical protein